MSEVKKIATRESYGNALKLSLALRIRTLWYWMLTLPAATKTGVFKKAYPGSILSTAVSQRAI